MHLPSPEAPQPVEPQQRGRDRRAAGHRDRQRQGEAGIDAGAMLVGEPVGEIQHKTGEQPRLGETEQEAYRHEAVGAGRESGAARDDPPGDHDAGDPDARADLFEDDVARHLEQHVAPEERAGRHAVPRRVEADILVHRQRGEADIDAVEIAEEIGQDRKGQDAQIDLAHRGLFDGSKHILHQNYLSSCVALREHNAK